VYLDSSDLELINDGNDQQVGLRFTGVAIPQGATVLNAYVQFTVDETPSGTTSLIVQAEANDNPATFETSTSNISSRPKTVNSVSWDPPVWSTLNQSGIDQQTPNLAPVIQEVVNRSGWVSGNALAILISGTGKRVAFAYDGSSTAAPRLHIEYTTGATATPTVTPTPTLTPTTTTVPATATSSPAQTLILQPNAANGVDNYILSSGTTNYGGAADISIGERNDSTNSNARTLIKFDLSSLPTNAVIQSASLSIWTVEDKSDTDTTVNVYRLKRPFNETTSNWNKADASTNWEVAGAAGGNDRESNSIGSIAIAANEPLNTEKVIALDPAKIQEYVNGVFVNN
ncbi:MAG: DNRLRE domain-containing protein, partial [Flavobacteriales bacterium]|nr:DNRLRE domain-containing protein [Flavobacteriales bacterium]